MLTERMTGLEARAEQQSAEAVQLRESLDATKLEVTSSNERTSQLRAQLNEHAAKIRDLSAWPQQQKLESKRLREQLEEDADKITDLSAQLQQQQLESTRLGGQVKEDASKIKGLSTQLHQQEQ